MTEWTKPKILVVDDEPVNVDIPKAHLCMDYDGVTASRTGRVSRSIAVTPI